MGGAAHVGMVGEGLGCLGCDHGGCGVGVGEGDARGAQVSLPHSMVGVGECGGAEAMWGNSWGIGGTPYSWVGSTGPLLSSPPVVVYPKP